MSIPEKDVTVFLKNPNVNVLKRNKERNLFNIKKEANTIASYEVRTGDNSHLRNEILRLIHCHLQSHSEHTDCKRMVYQNKLKLPSTVAIEIISKTVLYI